MGDSDNDFGEGLDLDDLDGEDSDFEEGVILGDLDEEDEDLSEQAIHEARLAGEWAIDDEDAEDEEGDEEEGLHDVLSEERENATEFLQINPVVVDQANVERFLTRLRNMIVSLIALVKSIDGNSFFGAAYSAGRAAGSIPVTRVWWQLLIKVDPEYLMELYSNAISIEVQSVLGQVAFNVNDLLRLVGDWRDPSWGVYLDILTKDGLTASGWFRLYVGSTVASEQRGLWKRIGTYFGWVKRRDSGRSCATIVNNGGGTHALAVLEPGTRIQFVKLAKFSDDIPRIYVHILETLMMIFIQTFKTATGSLFSPLKAVEWAIRLIPTGLSIIPDFVGLNRAWTLCQGTSTGLTKGRVCCICNIAHGEDGQKTWFHMDPSKPYTGMICHSCHIWRLNKSGMWHMAKPSEPRMTGTATGATNQYPLVKSHGHKYFEGAGWFASFSMQDMHTRLAGRRPKFASGEPARDPNILLKARF